VRLALCGISNVLTQPDGKGGFVDLAGGKGLRQRGGLSLGSDELVAVPVEKDVGSHKAHPLVAVDERLVGDDAGGVSGAKRGEVGCFIAAQIPGPCKRGLEQALVAQAGGASEFRQNHLVDGEKHMFFKPGGLAAGHFASSRSVLRYARMPFWALLSWASNSGS